MEAEVEKRKPLALFMAFGTKGDVYPIAAIAAAFAFDQKQYHVVLVTHSAHEKGKTRMLIAIYSLSPLSLKFWGPLNTVSFLMDAIISLLFLQNLRPYLADRYIAFLPIRSPPVLSIHENYSSTGMQESAFSLQKTIIRKEHRRECHSAIERMFGDGPSMKGDFIVINFFALEGWSLAELFRVRCVVAAPYIIPYSAPSSFECHFKKEFPLLYEYLQEAPTDKVCWKDVIHWMWPLFMENWGSWRSDELNLSPIPFTDPVTGLPTWHDWPPSQLLLYGFSKEIVECPDYWPSKARVCGFWFLPMEWQFSCKKCLQISALPSPGSNRTKVEICAAHVKLQLFLGTSVPPVFIGLSSAGSMGFLENPEAFLRVIQTVLEITNFRFILFTSGYEPLDEAIRVVATESLYLDQQQYSEEGVCLFDGRLFCFPGMLPYSWLFQRCLAAVHHGGSGSTAAALYAGIPQVLCPFMLDQFYWAERMHWLGVAPEPLKRNHLVPDKMDDLRIRIAANVLSRAIAYALSPEVKTRALEIAERISLEDGVMEAVKILKQEIDCSN